MPPFTYRLRFLIPRDRLPHTAPDEPHLIRLKGDTVKLHINQGEGTRPDALVLTQHGIATVDQAREQAEATKYALMRTGLVTNVPMLFGKNESSIRLSSVLVERIREASGVTPRPDVHGIDVMDEADGPTATFQLQAEGYVRSPIDRFLAELTATLDRNWRDFASHARLGLAVEVFMGADMERTPRTRFLDLVTVLEILADRGSRAQAAIAIVDGALAVLEGQRASMGDEEANSLRSALSELKTRSISRSIRDLAAGLDTARIAGFKESDIGRFLGRCYTLRSRLVHDGVAPETYDVAQMSGDLFFLVRYLLIRRIDELSAV
ncbi:MAG: hypothetical protein FIB00_16660 [Chloroflexi bacterium]|nr:hypothetical protein [Chloroflexota bacterium]PWB43400.1 MAG: hypothetical protein C3F10_11990 [Dehalococcoidia bacterium]